MKKATIIAVIALSIVISYQSSLNDFITTDYTESEINIEILYESDEEYSTEHTEEIGFLFLDPDTDIFFTMLGDGWYYEKDDNMTIFYNKNSYSPTSSIVISSQINLILENTRMDQTSEYFCMFLHNSKNILVNIAFPYVGESIHGDYAYYIYEYTADIETDSHPVAGKYLCWWVGSREYTCSMFCYEEDYELFSAAIDGLLSSFQPASELH